MDKTPKMTRTTTPHELGSAPIEPEHFVLMNTLADVLDESFNPEWVKDKESKRNIGFILMVFPFEGNAGRCNYISNANREDVVTMLREQLAYFSGMPEPPAAGGRG